MTVTVVQIRAEDVKVGDIERHWSIPKGRMLPFRRVANVERLSVTGLFVTFTYENNDRNGGSVRALDLVEVQRDQP